ncbi:hypothetical protein EOE67_12465 [Rheinheimera riviphila]|uniref:PEP-CTERM sorting domain-containing protein n=1 Tax=Rheinheimera riviphila TaxID=1834037 RepID=A0A437QRI3_9GAMM|nr:hypothetical protein [Rheinheimera riviphila]RVU37116.1 hypothetical protein EOE67_12465 [Rheinheimera riviphila]
MNILKKAFLPLVLAAASLLCAGQAQAALITIETDKQQYQVGGKVTAFLKLSDASSLISGFFLAMQYQNSALALVNWGHGNSFDDGFGSYQYSAHDAVNGSLALEDYADWAADQAVLAALQLGGFTLAKIEFTALAAGQFSLNLDPSYFGLLTFSGDLLQPEWLDASFDVIAKPSAVPATPAVALMIGGLLLLGAQRRQQQKSEVKAVAN